MAHRRSSVLIVAFALGVAVAQPAWGASPKETMQAFFAGANAALQSADADSGPEAPRQAIRALVNQIFDYRDAAARALGPAWLLRTPEQQAEFVGLFTDFLERGYIAFVGTKANVSDGLQIRYVDETITGSAAVVGTTLLTRNSSELDVDYFMVRRGERWMVRDVVVDGMSLIANYRAQFNRILSNGSYAELVAKMQGDSLEAPQAAIAAADPAVAPAPPTAPAPLVAAAPVVTPVTPAPPAPPMTPAPAAAPLIASAPLPAKPVPLPEVIVPAPIAPPAAAPPVARQEVHVAARPVEEAAAKIETIRVSAPEPATPVQPAAPATKIQSRIAATQYWIQVGAFRTVGAAVQLAERLRRQGMSALNDPLTTVPGHPAGALARVRVGPFATQSDAKSKLRELVARGYTPFIAEPRH